MAESEIPRAIEKEAREVCRKVEAMPSDGNAFIVADEIWRRVLIERERCAKVAEETGKAYCRDHFVMMGPAGIAHKIAHAIRRDNPNET